MGGRYMIDEVIVRFEDGDGDGDGANQSKANQGKGKESNAVQ